VDREPLIVLMPDDHASQPRSDSPTEFVGEISSAFEQGQVLRRDEDICAAAGSRSNWITVETCDGMSLVAHRGWRDAAIKT